MVGRLKLFSELDLNSHSRVVFGTDKENFAYPHLVVAYSGVAACAHVSFFEQQARLPLAKTNYGEVFPCRRFYIESPILEVGGVAGCRLHCPSRHCPTLVMRHGR